MGALRRLLTPITPGATRAIVILFALTLAVGAVNLLFTVSYVSGSNHKFCQVVTGVTSVPVPRPADPKANPSRETSWEWYERFVALGRSLGCQEDIMTTTTGRRVQSFAEIVRPGDYFGPTTEFTSIPAVFERPRRRRTFRECPDGSLEIRASISNLLRGDTAGHSDDGWHGYLDEGHIWRQV